MGVLQNKALIKSILILLFVFGLYFQHNIGLADNGDFTRSMGMFTSGPVGSEANWPTDNVEEWNKRFFNYWIPYWKFDWNLSAIPTSSAFVLWLPGAILNYIFFSKEVLWLESFSLLPKALLLAVLLLLFKWVDLQKKYQTLLLVGLGFPLVLMFTNTEYMVYFNSFFQESASFTFFFLTLASILFFKRNPSKLRLIACFALILLFSASKASYLYWPLLTIPIVLRIWYLKGEAELRKVIIIGVSTVLLFTFISMGLTRTSLQENRYNSLYFGVLTFSNDPASHLKQLGMEDCMAGLGLNSFTAAGNQSMIKHKQSYFNTLLVIYREPLTIVRELNYAAEQMQVLTLDALGKYSYGDARTQTDSYSEHLKSSNELTPLTLWSKLKRKLFPNGYRLFIVLAAAIPWFIFRLKHSTGIHYDLALIGLPTSLATIIDMIVAILGDGKGDLVKHLFFANLSFDVAFIVLINSIAMFGASWYKSKGYNFFDSGRDWLDRHLQPKFGNS